MRTLPTQSYLPHAIICVVLMGLGFICSLGGNTLKHESGKVVPAIHENSTRHASIVFGGDVMTHLPQITAAKRDSTYDFTEAFKYVKPFFDTADVVVLNLETTISATGNYSGYPLFSSPPELISALQKSGVDILALANNHICDKGSAGIRSTVAAIEEAGLKYTGAFADSASYTRLHPLRFDAGGIRFSLLNYTYGTNGMPVPRGMIVNTIDTARIAADLEKAAADNADAIIVYFHWGVEYMREPTQHEKELALWCHEKGADIVVGSHPHVLQRPRTTVDSAGIVRQVTVYSMGNLISNQRKRYTDGGMLIRLDFEMRDTPAVIEAQYMLTWVHLNYDNGQRHYHILPSPVADTLLDKGTPSSISYNLFMTDSHRLLDNIPGFSEITLPLHLHTADK